MLRKSFEIANSQLVKTLDEFNQYKYSSCEINMRVNDYEGNWYTKIQNFKKHWEYQSSYHIDEYNEYKTSYIFNKPNQNCVVCCLYANDGEKYSTAALNIYEKEFNTVKYTNTLDIQYYYTKEFKGYRYLNFWNDLFMCLGIFGNRIRYKLEYKLDTK